jgi:hypothetical protein
MPNGQTRPTGRIGLFFNRPINGRAAVPAVGLRFESRYCLGPKGCCCSRRPDALNYGNQSPPNYRPRGIRPNRRPRCASRLLRFGRARWSSSSSVLWAGNRAAFSLRSADLRSWWGASRRGGSAPVGTELVDLVRMLAKCVRSNRPRALGDLPSRPMPRPLRQASLGEEDEM